METPHWCVARNTTKGSTVPIVDHEGGGIICKNGDTQTLGTANDGNNCLQTQAFLIKYISITCKRACAQPEEHLNLDLIVLGVVLGT